MSIKKNNSTDPCSLRSKAEEELAAQAGEPSQAHTLEESKRLFHELKVHQIELEMQNDELRRVQIELEKSRARYFALYDLAPIGYFTVSETGLILEANLTLANLLGRTRRNLVGQPISNFIVPEYQRFYYSYRQKIMETAEPLSFEIRLRRQDETWLWVQCDAKSVTELEGGQTLRMTVSDISKRKDLEFALRSAMEKAEENDRLKLNFLANMSHEIRTPMNAIIGFSDLLRDSTLADSKRDTYIDILQNSSENLLRLIDSILDISKIEAGQIILRETDGSVNDLLRKLKSAFLHSRLANKKSSDVHLRFVFLPEESALHKADFVRLNQVLENIIGNALKFTQKGFVECGCQPMADHLLFYVRDTGPGIPKERFEQVFKRFVQLEKDTQTRIHGGAGLGLAIAASFVEFWKGRIWLESEMGVGTTFFFTLPLKNQTSNERTPEQCKTAPQIPTSDWNGKNFLIVEDHEANIFMLQEMLSRSEARLYFARNGKEAQEFFHSLDSIDLVLMDIFLPDISGLELTKMVKQVHNKCTVIAQTAAAFAQDIEDCYSAGCDDIITKPIDSNRLVQLVNSHLAKKQAAQG